MGLLSWLFPTDADHLRRARALMTEGHHEKARKELMKCSLPEADGLYDECSIAIDKANLGVEKKRLAAAGFHGWKIDVSTTSARRKKELESLVAQEIAKAGVDLDVPEIDQAAVKAAVTRAQRRASKTGATETGVIRLVPIVAAKVQAQ